MTIKTELAIFYNGKFAAWQDGPEFSSKREAWEWLKSQGYKAADLNDRFMAYEVKP